MTNAEMAYKEIMEDMIESAKRFVVVQGIGDVVDRGGWMGFRPGQKDWHWTIIGFRDVEADLFEIDLSEEAEKEGEYEFSAIFQTFRDETPLEHISMRFTQTFAQREREQKLLDLLDFPDFLSE